MLIIALLSAWLTYVCINVALTVWYNYLSQKAFRKKAPHFKYVEECSIFTGNFIGVGRPRVCDKSWPELHQKLGPSFVHFVFDKPWLSTKDLGLIKTVLLDSGASNTDKHFIGIPFNDFNESILQNAGDAWHRQRKPISDGLANNKVRNANMIEDLDKCAEELTKILANCREHNKAKTGQDYILLSDTYETVLQFFLSAIFFVVYKSDKMVNMSAKEKQTWCHRLKLCSQTTSNPIMYISMALPFMRPIMRFFSNFTPIAWMRNDLMKYVELNISDNIRARNQTGASSRKGDFSQVETVGKFKRRLADSIIDSFIEKKITYSQMSSDLLLLFVVGYETGSTTSAYLLWILAHHHEEQEKLRNAIELEGCDADYVIWCIYEAVRLHPAVPFGGGRILAEDLIFKNQLYPKGLYIIPSVRCIHRDPEIWPSPNKFIPERWANRSQFHPAAFLGFGLGLRRCPGKYLAIQEMKILLKTILTQYKIEKCADTMKEYHFHDPSWIYTELSENVKLRLVPLSSSEVVD